MLRILILCFMLKAAASLEMEGSSGDFPDDEDLHGLSLKDVLKTQREPSTDAQTSPSSWIIPVAVTAGLTVLTVLVIAGVLIRKRSRSQQQGVYTVPVEQSKKKQFDCSNLLVWVQTLHAFRDNVPVLEAVFKLPAFNTTAPH